MGEVVAISVAVERRHPTPASEVEAKVASIFERVNTNGEQFIERGAILNGGQPPDEIIPEACTDELAYLEAVRLELSVFHSTDEDEDRELRRACVCYGKSPLYNFAHSYFGWRLYLQHNTPIAKRRLKWWFKRMRARESGAGAELALAKMRGWVK
jgi:hypothetical protein